MKEAHEHHRVSEQGKQLGRVMSRLAERGRELLGAMGLLNLNLPGARDEMCATCACRPGTVPNGCLQTQGDLLKTLVEGKPFLCHSPKDGRLCAGWVASRAALMRLPEIPEPLRALAAQWEYSPPDEATPP